MSFQGKPIPQPCNFPHFSSPDGENTNTEVTQAKKRGGNSTKVTSFNPPYTRAGLQALALLYRRQNGGSTGLQNLVNIEPEVKGKVRIQACLIHTQTASYTSITPPHPPPPPLEVVHNLALNLSSLSRRDRKCMHPGAVEGWVT